MEARLIVTNYHLHSVICCERCMFACSRYFKNNLAEAMTKPDEILKNAVENVLADDGFKTQTPSSRSAVEDAQKH